jgi:hypothetical protein
VSEPRKLPFDRPRQSAILWYLITDRPFFEQAKSRIQTGWFIDDRVGRVYKLLLDFASDAGRQPMSDSEFKESNQFLSEDSEATRRSLRAIVDQAKLDADRYGLDLIKKDLTQWMKAAIFRGASGEADRLYNQGKFNECYSLVSEKMKEVQDAQFEDDASIPFGNADVYLLESEESYQHGCTFGSSLVDMALTPTGTPEEGGLYRGDTTVVLAPANVGKTTILITTAVANVWKGKTVFIMTHEGRPADIREKILCCAMGMTKPELFAAYKTPAGLAAIEAVTRVLAQRMVYVPYNKAGMTVEDVMPIIRRRQDEWAALHNGEGFDMLVSDYPAKLSTSMASHGHLQRRTIDEVVYGYYVQLALELKFHSLLAIQTNREGSKVNRDKDRLLTMEDVLESWGPMTSATNVITGNRSDLDASKRRLTLYVAKSRSSDKGRAIVCRTNYAASQAFSDKLGGTWYRGTDIVSNDEIEQYLMEYGGKAIPEHVGKNITPEKKE